MTGSGCREASYGGFGGGHPPFLPHASDLQIRSSMCGRPDPFRSVRDLGRVPVGCLWKSGESRCRSSVWLPAWLPVVLDVWQSAPGLEPVLSAWEVCGAARLRPGDSVACGNLAGLTASDCDCPRALFLSGTQRAWRPLRFELAAPLGVWLSSQLARCGVGRPCWRLEADVAVLPCCTAPHNCTTLFLPLATRSLQGMARVLAEVQPVLGHLSGLTSHARR